VHVTDSYPALHYLQDLPLLQDGQEIIIRLGLVFLPLHEERLVGLRVHSSVQQMLVAASDLLGKSKPANQSYLNGPHLILENIITHLRTAIYHAIESSLEFSPFIVLSQ